MWGDLVVANAFQNTDLFWALRGGDGGTFRITVNTTMRAFPDVPGISFSLQGQISCHDPRYRTVSKPSSILPDKL
ncbi:hypothetical protein BDW66DRAFT_154157 [Aspergillus desertorum]